MSVYAYGNITSDIRDMFAGIPDPDDEYVFFRSSQYDYVMYVGDIEYINGRFVGSALDIYTYDSQYNQTQSNPLTFIHSSGSLNMSPGSSLIFSSLSDSGKPPLLGVREREGSYISIFAISVLFVFLVVDGIFRNVLPRFRS